MSNAPFCNVKGVEIAGQPSSIVLQAVPQATDLSSALKAIQALTNNFNALQNKITNGFANSAQTIKSNNSNTIDWNEDRGKRVTERVKIANPNDPSQFVEVDQIKSYTMRNKKSGETFKWQQ